MREIDKPSEKLYTVLCQSQCSSLWTVCLVCRSQGSVVKKLTQFESKTLVLEERLHTSELLLQEKDRLVDHLQRKTDRDKWFYLFQQQTVLKDKKKRNYMYV